ncbi:MAG: hypothetical protein WCO82_01475 [Sphingomonadales bacterium]
MTLNVRVHGRLGEFVAENVGETGLYENVSEYVRDLSARIRSGLSKNGSNGCRPSWPWRLPRRMKIMSR